MATAMASRVRCDPRRRCDRQLNTAVVHSLVSEWELVHRTEIQPPLLQASNNNAAAVVTARVAKNMADDTTTGLCTAATIATAAATERDKVAAERMASRVAAEKVAAEKVAAERVAAERVEATAATKAALAENAGAATGSAGAAAGSAGAAAGKARATAAAPIASAISERQALHPLLQLTYVPNAASVCICSRAQTTVRRAMRVHALSRGEILISRAGEIGEIGEGRAAPSPLGDRLELKANGDGSLDDGSHHNVRCVIGLVIGIALGPH